MLYASQGSNPRSESTDRKEEEDVLSRILSKVPTMEELAAKRNATWIERSSHLVEDILYDAPGVLIGTQHDIQEALQVRQHLTI